MNLKEGRLAKHRQAWASMKSYETLTMPKHGKVKIIVKPEDNKQTSRHQQNREERKDNRDVQKWKSIEYCEQMDEDNNDC